MLQICQAKRTEQGWLPRKSGDITQATAMSSRGLSTPSHWCPHTTLGKAAPVSQPGPSVEGKMGIKIVHHSRVS